MKIPVVFCANEYLLPMLSVTLRSMEETAVNSRYEVKLLMKEIPECAEMLRAEVSEYKHLDIEFISIGEESESFNFFTGNRPDLPQEAYYRLFIPEYSEYDKVIYLDCDVIVLKDLEEMYGCELGDRMIGAVRDYTGIGMYHGRVDGGREYYDNEIGFKNYNDYFNSGVLLMNLKAIREMLGEDGLIRIAMENDFRNHDQDVLNIACAESKLILDAKWNCIIKEHHDKNLPEVLREEIDNARKDPAIVHFAGLHMKPWVNDTEEAYQYFWPVAGRSVFINMLLDRTGSIRLKRCIPRRELAFEVDLAGHCNLNCKACAHFSPLIKEELADAGELEKSFVRLGELFEGRVSSIHLMGGEPLLHPDINSIMASARKAFPEGKIQIVTNGIRLTQMDEAFWLCCHDNDIEISVTRYPIDIKTEEIRAAGLMFDVAMTFFNNSGNEDVHFRKHLFDPSGTRDIKYNFFNCYLANECIQLKGHRLYPCSLAGRSYRLESVFPSGIAECEEDSIDIFKAKDKEEILNFLCKPIPFCRYCAVDEWYGHEMKWGLSKKERDEWLLEEP
ncbi:MAG: radical SAM protein [Lachnospiraceae bacterium]|nr:radical SAM protein [Lachnospiraceae bacterium]